MFKRLAIAFCAACLIVGNLLAQEILTPKPANTPRINGARVFGVRPGHPFLFTIPATGADSITYSAKGLPEGLKLDPATGRITGAAPMKAGDIKVTLIATNSMGSDSKPLTIKVGDTIGLTPPMGWNSWNAGGPSVDERKVRDAAEAMVNKGLIKHGWAYINIDDAWQGERGGEFKGIQPNKKFPDMKKLADDIHAMGLKIGIYSTPWCTSYAGYIGGSSDDENGAWTKTGRERKNGKYSFADNDAKQWAAWGIDYLKYDWNPAQQPEKMEPFHKQTDDMQKALLGCGRDIFYSYSNSMPFGEIADQSKMLNAWRTTGDIRDNWQNMAPKGFGGDRWAKFAGPGHWNDPDMLVVGQVGWAGRVHPSDLTRDEQYTHISLWCLVASPLLIGCDMAQLDDFTLGLLTNDEVLAVNQDSLGKQGTHVKEDAETGVDVIARPLADGTLAVGLFNRGRYDLTPPARARAGQPAPPQVWKVTDRSTKKSEEFATQEEAKAALAKVAGPVQSTVKWSDLNLSGSQNVRDLWRQKDLGPSDASFSANVPYHGVVMVKIGTPKSTD